jgi:serine/threonine protein kinase
MALAPGARLGPYEVLAPIGAGGMGEVYRARDTRLDRTVAIEVLPDAFARSADRLARFEREARAVAAISHPNILDIHDVGSDNGRTFVGTELLDGDTLRGRRFAPTSPLGPAGSSSRSKNARPASASASSSGRRDSEDPLRVGSREVPAAGSR